MTWPPLSLLSDDRFSIDTVSLSLHELQCAVIVRQVEIFFGARRRPALDLLAQDQHVVEALDAELGVGIEAKAWLDHQVIAAGGERAGKPPLVHQERDRFVAVALVEHPTQR